MNQMVTETVKYLENHNQNFWTIVEDALGTKVEYSPRNEEYWIEDYFGNQCQIEWIDGEISYNNESETLRLSEIKTVEDFINMIKNSQFYCENIQYRNYGDSDTDSLRDVISEMIESLSYTSYNEDEDDVQSQDYRCIGIAFGENDMTITLDIVGIDSTEIYVNGLTDEPYAEIMNKVEMEIKSTMDSMELPYYE